MKERILLWHVIVKATRRSRPPISGSTRKSAPRRSAPRSTRAGCPAAKASRTSSSPKRSVSSKNKGAGASWLLSHLDVKRLKQGIDNMCNCDILVLSKERKLKQMEKFFALLCAIVIGIHKVAELCFRRQKLRTYRLTIENRRVFIVIVIK